MLTMVWGEEKKAPHHLPKVGKKHICSSKRGKKRIHSLHAHKPLEEHIYVLGAGQFMEFSTVDKALFYAESLKAQCDCPVYVLRGDRSLTKDCLLTAAEYINYPEDFNVKLFMEDLRRTFGTGKEVEVCRTIRNLEEVIPLLKASGAEEMAQEVEAFLRKR